MKTHEQLNPSALKGKSALLVAADSPRQAFYRIWIEDIDGQINVVKESGVKDRVLDRRRWPVEDYEEAEKACQRRIKAKTKPDRKSPRKYRLIRSS